MTEVLFTRNPRAPRTLLQQQMRIVAHSSTCKRTGATGRHATLTAGARMCLHCRVAQARRSPKTAHTIQTTCSRLDKLRLRPGGGARALGYSERHADSSELLILRCTRTCGIPTGMRHTSITALKRGRLACSSSGRATAASSSWIASRARGTHDTVHDTVHNTLTRCEAGQDRGRTAVPGWNDIPEPCSRRCSEAACEHCGLNITGCTCLSDSGLAWPHAMQGGLVRRDPWAAPRCTLGATTLRKQSVAVLVLRAVRATRTQLNGRSPRSKVDEDSATHVQYLPRRI